MLDGFVKLQVQDLNRVNKVDTAVSVDFLFTCFGVGDAYVLGLIRCVLV